MRSVTRRCFIAAVGGVVLPFAVPPVRAGAPKKVVVVGAGLAGLAAAFELDQAGMDVTVIEQSDRVGGRIKTVHGQFADDAWVDVGGQTSGGGYANFFYYATKFGLGFEPQQSPTGAPRPDILLHLDGELLSADALRGKPDAWPVALSSTEKPLAPLRLLGHYLQPIAEEIGAVKNVLRPEFSHYDELSLEQLLESQGASPAAIGMIDHTLNYNSVSTVSALSALRDYARRLTAGRAGAALNLANGNSDLPDAFARELGDQIRLRTTLVAMRQGDNGVSLQVESNGQRDNLYASHVVVAIPFTALRKILIEPGLPAGRQKIINELPYTQIAQTYLQTSRRFWETDGPVAMVVSDGPLERLFDASNKLPGDRGLLVNWVNGTGVHNVDADDPERHLDRVLSELEKVWPGCREYVEVTLTNNWSSTYVKGAYAHYAPGQMSRYAAEIPQPVGDLHFAGEHTELVAPGMEGALTSGKRAAAEILERTIT